MDELNEQLYQLVFQACSHPIGSPLRQKNLTKIIRLVSRKLWKEETAYYQDALQQTWVFFCQNICESGTGGQYDPTRSSIPTWLNTYLKRRLQDFYLEAQKQRSIRITTHGLRHPRSGDSSAMLDPIDRLPADPDIPPILERVREWAETDADGELRQTHIKDHPDINCQVLILKRLPPEVSWKTLAAEFDLPLATLSAFYQRQCMPRLRKFGELDGYL